MVRWESEYISDLIGRKVAPVMCFVDPVLPQPVTTLGEVIVCRASVLLTVVRSAHTTISEADLHAIIDALVPLTDGSITALDTSTEAALWPMSGLDTTGPVALVAATSAGDESPPAPPRPPRPRRSMVLAVSCLLAVMASAAIVLAISHASGDPLAKIAATSSIAPRVTTTTATVPDTVAATTTTLVDPNGQYRFTCPVDGQGWTLELAWAGDVPKIAFYDYSYQDPPTGQWISIGTMTSAAASSPELHGMPSEQKRIIRVIPAYTTGIAGQPTAFLVQAPSAAC